MVERANRVGILVCCVVCLLAGVSGSSIASAYGREENDAGCTADIDMAHFYGCLDQKRNAQRALLDAVVNRVIAIAKAGHHPDSATDIERAERDWLSWMAGECRLEGVLDGGAAAPSPWLERCELRMMKERVKTVRQIQDIVGVLASH